MSTEKPMNQNFMPPAVVYESAHAKGQVSTAAPSSASASAPGAPGSSSRLSAVPASARASPQLNALCQRAANGAVEDVKRLAKWSSLMEHEAQMLRHRLRKQQHDFATLFEIVGQTSARALDVVSMQTYLLRTVSGHFATTQVLIMRRMRAEDRALVCSAAQGVRDTGQVFALDSALCLHAMERRYCFSLNDLARESPESPELTALNALGVDLVVPLVQEVEGSGAVLEGIILLGRRLSGQPYCEEDIEFLHILGKMLAICLRNEALYRRSIIDDLTGVASRGHFDAQLSQELNRIAAYGHRGLGLVMLDVDQFKHFNDTYGHQTGDRVLQELAKVLIEQVRNVDLVARYGGEEFAIILLEIERPVVLEVANRLRRAVEDMQVLSAQGQPLRVTASFGLACFPDDASEKSTLIQQADEALYISKAAGRNRVTMTQPGSGLKRSISAVEMQKAALTPAGSGADSDTVLLPRPAGDAGRSARQSEGRSGSRRGNPGAIWTEPPELARIQRQQKELLGESDPPAAERRKNRSS